MKIARTNQYNQQGEGERSHEEGPSLGIRRRPSSSRSRWRGWGGRRWDTCGPGAEEVPLTLSMEDKAGVASRRWLFKENAKKIYLPRTRSNF